MHDWIDATIPLLLVFTMLAVALFASRQRALLRRSGAVRAPRPRWVEANVSWMGTYTQAFQRVLDVLELLDTRLLSADPNRGTVIARTEVAGASPPILPVTLRLVLTTQQGVTFVHMEAMPSVPFMRGGAQRLINDFLRAWDRLPAPIRAQNG